MIDLKVEAQKELQRLFDFACRELGYKDEIPYLMFEVKGTCAGTAEGEGNIIDLNPCIMDHVGMRFVETTVGHEFAHIMSLRNDCAGGHGEVWKGYMRKLGMIEIEQCHTYNVAGYSLGKGTHRRWLYKCPWCGYEDDTVATGMKNRIEGGTSLLLCDACNGEMAMVDGDDDKTE